jgi:hypothetical protein
MKFLANGTIIATRSMLFFADEGHKQLLLLQTTDQRQQQLGQKVK